MNIQDHKFILLASYTGNTLGQIRSLGEKGIKPIAVLVHKNTFRIDKSKYIGKLYNVKSIDEGLDLIIEKYGNDALSDIDHYKNVQSGIGLASMLAVVGTMAIGFILGTRKKAKKI